MHATETLRTLHRIHRQLADLHDRIERGPRQIRACEATVEKLQQELDSIQQRTTQARMSADQKQLQLKTSEDKIRDLKGKLNACKTNREFQALKEQIAADEMANSVLADEILETLEKIDELQAQVSQAEAKVASAEEQLAKVRETVHHEREQLLAEVHRLETELADAESKLPHDVREIYDRVIRAKGADGMAAVEGENCTGCFHQITPNAFDSVRLGKVVCCGSCGRILYLPEDLSTGK